MKLLRKNILLICLLLIQYFNISNCFTAIYNEPYVKNTSIDLSLDMTLFTTKSYVANRWGFPFITGVLGMFGLNMAINEASINIYEVIYFTPELNYHLAFAADGFGYSGISRLHRHIFGLGMNFKIPLYKYMLLDIYSGFLLCYTPSILSQTEQNKPKDNNIFSYGGYLHSAFVLNFGRISLYVPKLKIFLLPIGSNFNYGFFTIDFGIGVAI